MLIAETPCEQTRLSRTALNGICAHRTFWIRSLRQPVSFPNSVISPCPPGGNTNRKLKHVTGEYQKLPLSLKSVRVANHMCLQDTEKGGYGNVS